MHTLGIYHWKDIFALLFVSSIFFLNLVVHRLDSQAKGDGVVRLFARAALYRDDILALTAHQGLFLNQLEFDILAGGVTARVPACSLSRRCSSPAGGNLKRSELGRGLQLRTQELCLWTRGKAAMPGTPGGLPFAAKCARAHFASKWSRPSHRPPPRAAHPAAPCLYHLRAGRRVARARR